jgi:Anaphase-promoting complex, subunit 10 (APC10)
MRKRIRRVPSAQTSSRPEGGWLNLSEIATVEVSSEQDGFPIEAVFADTGGRGWRASRAGPQVIRILFDEPVAVRRIRLRFEEPQDKRTQEFTLRGD